MRVTLSVLIVRVFANDFLQKAVKIICPFFLPYRREFYYKFVNNDFNFSCTFRRKNPRDVDGD